MNETKRRYITRKRKYVAFADPNVNDLLSPCAEDNKIFMVEILTPSKIRKVFDKKERWLEYKIGTRDERDTLDGISEMVKISKRRVIREQMTSEQKLHFYNLAERVSLAMQHVLDLTDEETKAILDEADNLYRMPCSFSAIDSWKNIEQS